ncbi:hypothetical protein Pedsa_2892 [Pseudopedobacter saltans DSM 12145]|uniref:Hydrolase n=1 Tax=Pseudopedobacter saltans (strain ATCC 51119 / DSM 12145 / JCM 21818 / CCUG 39354 / LMG 10337 / NBRC 100064 / NCIMB 13643) TaxID=762903 RepID=F0S8G7_PSESL|nr:SGNH/GDSL hydrolase family protein [Pseudopedobacter saltans]ADY53431.1 hypothetical protein Pedsa_2892 [Pseudopedobacter saltans DSM 12145]
MYRTQLILILLSIFLSFQTLAQTSLKKYVSLTVLGKAKETENMFHRVDTTKYPLIPKSVKYLLTNSAGLFVSFKTNSTSIAAKWCTSDKKSSSNMTAIAYEGLDIYIKKDGKWQFAGVGRPGTKSCSESVLVSNMDSSEKECLVYLPLYDETKSLEIGVDENAKISENTNPFQKQIIVYGSSIVQGASASRPGLAYPSRLSRNTGLNFVNIGVSGSAKMEKEVADMVSEMPGDVYVLDCVPNSSPAEIKERTKYLVKKIRSSNPIAPIIIIQTIVREHGYFDKSVGLRVQQQNEEIKRQLEELVKESVKDLYFISADNLLGNDHEATTDGTHPNDLGFDRMIQKFQPEILNVLKKHKII